MPGAQEHATDRSHVLRTERRDGKPRGAESWWANEILMVRWVLPPSVSTLSSLSSLSSSSSSQTPAFPAHSPFLTYLLTPLISCPPGVLHVAAESSPGTVAFGRHQVVCGVSCRMRLIVTCLYMYTAPRVQSLQDQQTTWSLENRKQIYHQL